MRIVRMVLCVCVAVSVGCTKDKGAQSAAARGAAGPTSGGAPVAAGSLTPAASPAATPAGAEDDLVAFASGALVVQEPDPESANDASWLLRGPFETEHNWQVASAASQTVVIELPERSLVKRVEFDTGMVSTGAAREITVEVSDASAKAGFSRIADVSLQERADGQTFPASAQVPGRWIRLDVRSGYGAGGLGINRFRARGTRLTTTPFPDISGSYATRNGALRIKQEGASVIGCYDLHGGTVEGGIEGRVLKLTWHEKVEDHNEGAAFMVFSSDAQRWAGLFSYKGEDPNTGRFWTGTKRGSAPGSCPNWAGGVEQQMIKDIEEFGRARVYGINFDSDSDRIREESRAVLDHVAAMLKARPEWKITIEGHTDATASSQHNQELSERRASAVRKYLETAAIAAARLNAVGYGATRPVAANETALGRSQNRRVELVKQ
jgi:outer membrane protein OmpA-like peptidoglycan-associated protein